MITFVTYFDRNFLARGLALIDSLARTATMPWRIIVLALDETVADTLASFRCDRQLAPDQVAAVGVGDLIAVYPELGALAAARDRTDFYFTLTPYVCSFVLSKAKAGDRFAYLDADLYFFGDPAPLFQSEDAPVAIVEHRFPPRLAHLAERFGRFNVGFIGFTKAQAADDCVARWLDQCREWCRDVPEPGRYADQGYLDAWPATVPGLEIIDHPGANLAPWNLERHRLRSGPDGRVTVDGAPLIFFHFHRLRRRDRALYDAEYHGYGAIGDVTRTAIYPPYLAALDRLEKAYVASSADTGRLHRLERPLRSRFRNGLSTFLAVLRLFTRERVLFRQAAPLSPWRALGQLLASRSP